MSAGDVRATLAIGTLTKPHGVRGAIRVRCDVQHVDLLRAAAEAQLPLEVRPLEGAPYFILLRSVRGSDDSPILEFDGIDDRTAIDPFRGADIAAPREVLPPLEDDEFFLGDLDGCVVHDAASGARIGSVTGVENLPANVVLTVTLDLRDAGDSLSSEITEALADAPSAVAKSGVLLVPLIDAAVPLVDPDKRRVDIDLAFLGLASRD